MPDYIYLLENRLSPSQQSALQSIREAARESNMTVFLTGGAVRDLTSGSPVRDLDVSVQGNALDLKSQLEARGAVLWGEEAASQTLFARFPGSVRVEVSSTRREEFPRPGQPVYTPGSILEDLRRRDFTANAMALSLNEGSYGLLMDPLNGVADLEARLLRLVSNYGFLEDPIRMVRAARLQARLGWELEEKTKQRLENAKEEGVLASISPYQQGYEVEEILHEEDGLKILKALENDGWMKVLFPAWTSSKADTEGLESLREVLVQLQMQGVNPDPSAAQAQLLTAKLPAKDLVALKKLFVRQGFVKEWDTQDERAREFGKRLISKEASMPSAAWKLLTSSDPEAVLWLGLTRKSPQVQEKFKDFFQVWPEARQRIPYVLMQEMRIVPELAGYQELVKSIFFELIDGRLNSDEEMKQFLEPHSPPAPPPPVTIRRPRAKKSAEKKTREVDEDDPPVRGRSDDDESDDVDLDEESDSSDERGELIARSGLPVHDLPQEDDAAEPEPEVKVPPSPPAEEVSAPSAAQPAVPAKKSATTKADAPVRSETKKVTAPSQPVKTAPKPAPRPAKKVPAAAKPPLKVVAAKTPAKPSAKPVAKSVAKAPVKTAKVRAGATKPKKAAAKPAAKTIRKLLVKGNPTKPNAKVKAGSAKSKPATKAKVALKTKAKPPARGVALKKKR